MKTPLPSPTAQVWAALWRSANKLDGASSYIIHRNLLPALFRTRHQALDFINREYGYIRNRPDLQKEPHGWKIPKAVRVTITLNTKNQHHENS